MGLRQYTNASRVPQTEEEKLAAMAEAFGINQPPTEQDIAQQPVNVPEENVNMAALGETGPEISAQEIMEPSQADMIAQYIESQRAAGAPALARQNAGLAELKDKIKAYEGQKTGMNLAPALAWMDNWMGGNLAGSYKAPVTKEEKLAKIAEMYKGYQGELDKATAQQLAQGQNKLLGQSMMAQMKSEAATTRANTKMNQSAIINAQSQANAAEKQFIPRLEGAARIEGIFHDIDSGKVKSNAAVKSLIVSEIQRLETGASNPAYEGQTQKEMKTMAESLGETIQRMTGSPDDTVPKEVTDQLKALSRGLTKEYKRQADSSFETLKAGSLPNQRKVFEDKHKTIKDVYGKRFGFWDEQREPQAGLSMGQVVNGHKYLGGDPKQQDSWEK